MGATRYLKDLAETLAEGDNRNILRGMLEEHGIIPAPDDRELDGAPPDGASLDGVSPDESSSDGASADGASGDGVPSGGAARREG